MSVKTSNQIPFYYSPNFSSQDQHLWDNNIVYASFSRVGGVSLAPYDSLNVSFSVGDDPLLVYENLRIIKDFLGLDSINMVNQIHGNKVSCVDKANFSIFRTLSDADGLITTLKGQGLLIKHADCQSISLFDPNLGLIANIHCGWRGLAGGIIERTISMFKDKGSNPSDIFAVISPSLGPCCFEFIGWKELLPIWLQDFVVSSRYLDAWSASEFMLRRCGLLKKRIFNFRICTKCSLLHFSYRRERISGRLATVIALKKSDKIG